eukprot:376332_1
MSRIRRGRKRRSVNTKSNAEPPVKKRKKNKSINTHSNINLPKTQLNKLTKNKLKEEMKSLGIKFNDTDLKSSLIDKIIEYNTNKTANTNGNMNENKQKIANKNKKNNKNKRKVRFNFIPTIFGATKEEQNEMKNNKYIPERKNVESFGEKKMKRFARNKSVCVSVGFDNPILHGWIEQVKGNKIKIAWETENYDTKTKWYDKDNKKVWLKTHKMF